MSEYQSKSARKRPRDDYEESSWASNKRGRWSDPGFRGREQREDNDVKLESLVSRLGEKSSKSLESNINRLSDVLVDPTNKDDISAIIVKCVVSMTEKAAVYSTLIGLVNAKKYDIGEQILDLLVAELRNALALGQFAKTRYLVCFIAELVNCKVITVNSLVAFFDNLVTVTFEPDIPQVRSDCFVHMVLSALPMVGSELEERKRQDLDRLFVTIDNYMSKRSKVFLPTFKVWRSDKPHPQKDYLENLWAQVKALRENQWKSGVLLRLYTSFQSDIGGAYQHNLPSLDIPVHTADSAYPLPEVVFRLFSPDDTRHTPGLSLPAPESIDRFLVEDHVSRILYSHSNNRKECSAALLNWVEMAHGQLNLSTEYIVTETLFGHMMRLPHPPHVLVYYSSVLIELCKGSPGVYPQILSQTTELLFSRLDSMNTVAIDRFAVWFAHHLSNFKYQWDWSSWSPVVAGPADHPSVKLIKEVFRKCIRLACFEEFVEMIPQELRQLLPPSPVTVFQYNQDSDPSSEVAGRLLGAIRSKESMDNLQSILDSLGADCQGKMSILTQCVLKVGSKTITHTFLALVKFRPLFIELTSEDGTQAACLKAVAHFYSKNTQLHSLVIDKLLRMKVVSPLSVVQWALSDGADLSQAHLWEVLESTLTKATHHNLDIRKQLEQTKSQLDEISALDEVALGGDERDDIQSKLDELEEEVDSSKRSLKQVLLQLFECLVNSMPGQGALGQQCVVDYSRQLLVKYVEQLRGYAALLEDTVFTVGTPQPLMEAFQQFQALL